MEPLSISVAILSILGACSKSIKFIRSISDTPQELEILIVESDHLESVVKDIKRLLLVGSSSPSVLKNLNEAHSKVGDVHVFIEKRLQRAGSNPASKQVRVPRISRRALIRHKSHLKAFTEELIGIRARLVDCVAILNL